MDNKFTQKAENALINSLKIAEGFGHTYIGTEHLLLALSKNETSCSALILSRYSLTSDKINNIIKDYSGVGVKSELTPNDMTPRLKSILEEAYDLALKYGDGIIGTEHILLAILEENDSVAIKLLKRSKINLGSMRDEILALLKVRERHSQAPKKESVTPLLKQYGKNLCEMAKDDRFDPVIERDSETDRIIRILSRKTKNNPCLIGEAGVGKTAIVEGLAARIVKGDVPPPLIGKTIISVDLTSMVAGAKYRGDFEDRIKNIIAEAVKNKNIILFIDEIHTIVGAGAAEGAIDASNILKPQLARGELRLIGATTLAEYHRFIEKDSALERRFQPIIITEPSKSTTVNMLNALKPRYEKHHKVIIENDVIEDCVELSARYISDRFLPDKAIDVLDEACVIAINNFKKDNKSEQNILLDVFNKKGTKSIIEAYYSEHATEGDGYIENRIPHVNTQNVRSALSEICNIPLKMIKRDIDFTDIKANLNMKLPGREDAIESVINTIRKHDLGFSDPDRPRGIFLFIGNSGTGKTALAIELSKTLFFADNCLLRYDMSEFSEKHSISKLIGSPPGYVGHDDGGSLTEYVRKNPHCLILFDEIDKAEREVLNILLQISDYGYLKDSAGRRVDFKNSIIVMTANFRSENASAKSNVGFVEDARCSLKNRIIASVEKQYGSEFINRFDDVIFFEPITQEFLTKIADNRLSSFSDKVIKSGHTIEFCPAISAHLAKISSFTTGGIRALQRNISRMIESPVIDAISTCEANAKKHFEVTLENDAVKVSEMEKVLSN